MSAEVLAQVIVYTRPEDGGVSVVYPTGETTLETVLEQVPEGALNVRVTDAQNIPSDRTYRNAWTDQNPGEQVDVDLEKAKQIHMDRIREARNEKLLALDTEQMKSLRDPEKLLEIEDQKQVLRDLPETFELQADNPDALKALWPLEL